MNVIFTAYTLSECMEEMASLIERSEKQGVKNIIFCEDRLTLIAERTLVRRTGGTFLSSVSTFSRFLKAKGRAISKQGSVMAVGNIMTKLQREGALQCFTTATGVGSNAKGIYETLAQFSASEVTPEILEESLSLLPDDSLKRKTGDLAKIYREYTRFLQERAFLDESRYLSLLPAEIRADKSLRETNVFFLCYSSFTAQALSTVRAVIESAKNVIGIFCSGEEDIYANRAQTSFARVCAEYGDYKTVNKGQPIGGEAELLRVGLFNPERFSAAKTPTERIRIFEADDKVGEAEYVAVQIRRALAETDGLHYRDIAVLVPDVSSYTLPLKRALGEYGIPYFIDEKRSLGRHPLARFLLDVFRVVKERFSPVSVQSLLQNVFFGDSAEYRNYLYKYGNYRGGAKKEIKDGEEVQKRFSVARLQDSRNRLLLATKNIKARGQGREYCAAVRQILADFNAEEKLKDLEENIGDVSQKAYLAQIYDALDRVLEEAELLTGEREMTVSEFSAVLQDGLNATEISLIPLKYDAVFIGGISSSRIEKISILFAMGMTDAVPGSAADTAIVSDKEIARLAEVKTLLEPTVAEVNLRTRESVCLNLCTFIEELHFTYPLAADGEKPALSDVFRYVDAIFCGKDGNPIERRKTYTDGELRYVCSAITPAIRQMLIKKNAFQDGKDGVHSQKVYSSVYTALDKLSVRQNYDYLFEERGQVCVERAAQLLFRDGKITPTKLEKYFSCPYMAFAGEGLALKEREERAVCAMDTGNFVHAILQRLAPQVEKLPDENAARAFAREEGRKLLADPLFAVQADTASGELFGEKLLQEAADVAAAVYRQIAMSDFKVEGVEQSVSGEYYHGQIDRVDGTDKYVRVIDYKTGSIDETGSSYYTGRKLQMQLYMSAVLGERTPAGIFYFPAVSNYDTKDGPRFRMKGFINGDKDALRCGDKSITEDTNSEFFNASLAEKSSSQHVMDEETFRYFLKYGDLVSRQAATEIRQGYVEPTPYKEKCERCKFGGMCGFNKDVDAVRTEPAISAAQIAEIVKKTEEKGENND